MRGLIGTIKHLRPGLYKVARGLGDVQALASGKPRVVGRRLIRKTAGHAYSQLAGGRGGFVSVLLDIALMLLGRGVGGRGRW